MLDAVALIGVQTERFYTEPRSVRQNGFVIGRIVKRWGPRYTKVERRVKEKVAFILGNVSMYIKAWLLVTSRHQE